MWHVEELAPTDWWAVDGRTGAAHRLTEQQGRHLWRRHDLSNRPLNVALELAERGAADLHPPDFVDLSILNHTTRFVSNSPAALNFVREAFDGAQSITRTSPSAVAAITEEANVERLHRTVEAPRAGVRLLDLTKAGEDFVPASADLPVFPPLQLPYFADRFTAVHSAALAMASGLVLVCGHQKAGKTTTAILAETHGLGEILSDELFLLDDTGSGCGVPLPVRERTSTGREVRRFQRSSRTGQPLPVRHVLVVEHDVSSSLTPVTDARERLAILAPHARIVASDLAVGTGHLLTLVGRARVWRWKVRPWPDLRHDLLDGLRRMAREG